MSGEFIDRVSEWHYGYTTISSGQQHTAAPNILVLIADDLGWGDLSLHHGRPRTPQLDRLAKDGVKLQRLYAYPVCHPTRGSFLTAQMPRRFRIVYPFGLRMPGLPAGFAKLTATCWPLRTIREELRG